MGQGTVLLFTYFFFVLSVFLSLLQVRFAREKKRLMAKARGSVNEMVGEIFQAS